MRILATKICEDATITSTDESANYPASNLCHQFLRNRWQPIADGTQTITMDWSSVQSINCVFVGYISSTTTNLDIKIYNGSGLVETLSSVDISDGNGAYYFSQTHVDIVSLELIATGSGTMYIGGAEPGVYYQMPRQTSAHPEGRQDNSITSVSEWGQAQQYRVPWLDRCTYSWAGQLRSVWQEVVAQLEPIGVGGTLWVDFYEGDHSIKIPGYYRLAAFPDYTNNGHRYSFSIGLVEAR